VNAFYRGVAMTLLIILVGLAVLAALALLTPWSPTVALGQALRAFETERAPALHGILLVVAGLILLAGGLGLIILGRSEREDRRSRVDEARRRIARTVGQLPYVLEARPEVKLTRQGVDVHLRVKTDADDRTPEKGHAIMDALQAEFDREPVLKLHRVGIKMMHSRSHRSAGGDD